MTDIPSNINSDKIFMTPSSIDPDGIFKRPGTIPFVGSDNVFMWNNKKYRFQSYFVNPSITIRCVDDDSILSFDIKSELKDELVLCSES